jgi:hypothetical protein
MIQPPVALVNLTQEEKDRIAVISQKSIKRGLLIYFIPFVVFGALVAYINVNSIEIGIVDKPNLHGTLNVVLAILSLLCARLFVNVIMAHQKAINAWQKKVIKGKIQSKEGKIITVANQKVKLDNEQAQKVNTGDDVIVSVMPGGEFVLNIDIVAAP